MKRRIFLIATAVVLLFLLSGCMPSSLADPAYQRPAGFFLGIWHGWIAPLSLLVSIFNPFVGIYEANNTGFWYDAGFYMAIIGGFGGLSLLRKRRGGDD